MGVDDDGVGYGAQIVRTLCIGVAIGDDELACLLEVSKSIAYGLKRSRASRDEVASLYVYAFNLVTIGDKTVIPDGVTIGKNTAIAGKTTLEDYPNNTLAGGETLIKAGDM